MLKTFCSKLCYSEEILASFGDFSDGRIVPESGYKFTVILVGDSSAFLLAELACIGNNLGAFRFLSGDREFLPLELLKVTLSREFLLAVFCF